MANAKKADKVEGTNGTDKTKQVRKKTVACKRAITNSLSGFSPLVDNDHQEGNEKSQEENKHVLFMGCDGDFWKAIKRHFPNYGFDCTRAYEIEDLVEIIQDKNTPPVIVLGSDTEDITQIELLEQLKSIDRNIRVIFITESDNIDSARIIAAGADDIVSRDNAKPKALSNRIERVLKLHREEREEASLEPVICEIKNGKIEEMDEASIEKVKETIGRFSSSFDMHQKYNRHYAVINTILTSYPDHFGRKILDIGCGTGYPMRQFIRNVMIPEFAAEPMIREQTSILSVDSTPEMLIQAQIGYERLVRQYKDVVENSLAVDFMLADVLDLTLEVLKERGFDKLDTILASYFIHWAVDKEGAVRKAAELLVPGGKFITVEEWPLMVTPGPHMPLDLINLITTNSRPIKRKKYYKMLRNNGFRDLKDGVVVVKIDDHHEMYGNVFEKR